MYYPLSLNRLRAITLLTCCALAPKVAEAGPGPCPQPQYVPGTQTWQTCMIRHVGQVAYDASQRSVDNEANISYLAWQIDGLEQENADLRAELDALRADFDWNNRALGETQDAHQGTQDRVSWIERDLYGIPDTDYGGISAWIDLLTYHVTGEHGYALWWGPTVPEQMDEVATRLETLEDVCLP